MKKLKAFLMTVAITTAIAGAAASAPCWDCENAFQYKYDPSIPRWFDAGTYGGDYICISGPQSTCTWVYENGEYKACRLGIYYPLNAGRKAATETPKKENSAKQ